jgi:hypothetical protein
MRPVRRNAFSLQMKKGRSLKLLPFVIPGAVFYNILSNNSLNWS